MEPASESNVTDVLRMERQSALILTTKTCRSFQKRYFTRLWDKAMEAAGIQQVRLPGMDMPAELHFHDQRIPR